MMRESFVCMLMNNAFFYISISLYYYLKIILKLFKNNNINSYYIIKNGHGYIIFK